jgi:PPM family protein phosphatase
MSDALSTDGLSQATGNIIIKVFGRTDVGQIREHNEDNFIIADLSRRSRGLLEEHRLQTVGPRGSLLGVCDGMGGAAAGEVASQLAVDIIFEKLCAKPDPTGRDDLAARLVRSVEEAGIRIFNEARADRTRRGMGTTATVAALLDQRMFLAQVGDSRAYVLRAGVLMQVTRDQSLVTQLIEAGQLTEEEAETFEHNNIILQALGTADSVQVDLTYVDLRRGDRLLLCSDGLSGMIRSDEIRAVLSEMVEPIHVCKELTDRANRAGGHDNVTVIVADFDGAGILPLGVEDDSLQYRKYPVPEVGVDGHATIRVGPGSSGTLASALTPSIPTEPMVTAGPRVRVSHTMVGDSIPDAQEVAATPSAPSRPLPIRPSPAPLADSSVPLGPPPTPSYDPNKDPVVLPFSGLPPWAVLLLVIAAILVAGAAGYFIIR